MSARSADSSSRREASHRPRFLADSMHGKLARWLRMLGFDTIYYPEADNSIIQKSLEEERIVLTSDAELYRRLTSRGAGSVLLSLNDTEQQLSQVGLYLERNWRISRDDFLTPKFIFCSLCNGELERSTGERWVCKSCGQEYWRGSHWRNISRTLEKARRLMVEAAKR
ncbi:MAG: Mut7-C RNAse domain-containing protein [Nitrososphaerota archaeon]